MNWHSLHNVYFIGIGGIGMSALARYFRASALEVAGYDRTRTPLTEQLTAAGCRIHYEEAVDQIPEDLDPAHTLVVVTPAIPAEHAEWRYFRDRGFTLLKRAEVLGQISRHSTCLAVAGTHGKTTTSALLGYLLDKAGTGATAFLGGIAMDYDSNLILNQEELTVVEADEYDRSFLQLQPAIACITSMDADHLDFYGDGTKLKESFAAFAAKLKADQLLVKRGLPLLGLSYSIDEAADYQARGVQMRKGCYHFDLKTPSRCIPGWESPLPGRYNLENALAALAMADLLGVDVASLQPSLRAFKGVQRRFSIHHADEKHVYIDDYAHHPEAIRVFLESVRERYPNKRITGIFQPHLYSRTRDFMDDFAQVLAQFDQLLLLEVYPAREQPIPGVNATALLDRIQLKDKEITARHDLLNRLKKIDFEVLITLGAGDIDAFVEPIKALLRDET